MGVKYLIPLIYVLNLSMGCSQYPVSGFIDMKDSDKYPMVYLIEPMGFNALASTYEGKVLDSAKIDLKGNFKFEKMPENKDKKMYFLTIQRPGEPYPNRLENELPDESNYLPFIYKSYERVNIISSANKLLKAASIISNISENEDIVQFIKKRSELYQSIMINKAEIEESSLLELENTKLTYQTKLMALVSESTDVYVNALALRWVSPNSDYERIPELVKETCQKLQISAPNHAMTLQICKKSMQLPLTVGDKFPNYPLPMSNSDTINIYDLFGHKLTLVDLWATWCAPCRHENKSTLVPMWDKFQNEGFQIIGYALDTNEKGWKNAIEKDGVSRWPHASHLKGDESPLFEKLKITTIPANYIVDQEGTILAKNLHGTELYRWVEEYLK